MADEPKPPYVRFEVRAIEDRTASIQQGHYVARDVIFAIVTPAGTRDVIEREVDDWLNNIKEGIKQERIPSFWLDAYERSLKNFKEAQENPEFGTPVKDWPSASPAQIRTLLEINIRTVEELAAANEEALGRIGMGGRALKQKAIIWLESAQDSGKLTEEVNSLRQQNEELLARDKERETQLKSLQQTVDALTAKTAEVTE